MATNFGSIVGGIIRGLSNDRRSVALTGHNVTTDNPNTYTWIGQEPGDLRQPIQKEMSQNPSLPFEKASSGSQYEYTQPLPTDIRTLITAGSPGTDISPTTYASSIGSWVQRVPSLVPMNNGQFNGYGMSPQNADHFKVHFANQIGMRNMMAAPSASIVATAIQEQANINTDGPTDPWENALSLFQFMRKSYTPSSQYQKT
jgi:hypothetical protein